MQLLSESHAIGLSELLPSRIQRGPHLRAGAGVLGCAPTRLPSLGQVALSPLAYGLSAPPHILYNPAQQILAYAGFCQTTGTLPAGSPCPLPLQVG